MTDLLTKLPPMRLEKRRRKAASSTSATNRPMSRDEATATLEDLVARRGQRGATAELRDLLKRCHRDGHRDILLRGFFGFYRVETLNRADAERANANSTTIAAKQERLQRQNQRLDEDSEVVLLAAAACFEAGDVALGREALKSGSSALPASVRSSLVEALAKGAARPSGAPAFRLALRQLDEARLSSSGSGGSGEEGGNLRVKIPDLSWCIQLLD